MINAPAGFWERGNLANIGFNRWAFDVNAAVTHLDQSTGLELSSAVGLTFNVENPDTDYKTGTEFHLELAAMQYFSKTFAAGISPATTTNRSPATAGPARGSETSRDAS